MAEAGQAHADKRPAALPQVSVLRPADAQLHEAWTAMFLGPAPLVIRQAAPCLQIRRLQALSDRRPVNGDLTVPPQATDLERRVLAHERILQFLLAEMARGDAPLLDRLLVVFSPQGRKAHQHDYTDAEDYAEAFIRQVAKLNEEKAAQKLKVDYPPSRSMTPPREIPTEVPVVVEPRSGVWQVRRLTSHIGDYLDRSAAVETALLIAIAECRLGANVKLVVEGVSIPVGDTERS